MARNNRAHTWAPTAAGQIVLYGVQGQTDERGTDRGYLVIMTEGSSDHFRNLFHGRNGQKALSTKVRIADQDAAGNYRLIPRVAEEDRGTYTVEPVETPEGEPPELTVVLHLRGQEHYRFTLLPALRMEKRVPRSQEFELVQES
jgi:hypothetical protein